MDAFENNFDISENSFFQCPEIYLASKFFSPAQTFSVGLRISFEEQQPTLSPPTHYCGRLQKHF